MGLGSHNNSLKRSIGGVNAAPTQSNQTYSYATQIKEAAERSSFGAHAQAGYHTNKGGAKHHGHRKHQPVPIDTFNIVSNRRKSLVKQVNEANASADAMIGFNPGPGPAHMHTDGTVLVN